MAKRIFIWVAHPRPGSLCEGIADAYQAGAGRSDAEIRRLNLSEMSFDSEFEGYGDTSPALEPDLVAWQDGIAWADHLFFVHPYWWGAMPTRAKAVLDRALTPGFGFKYHQKGVAWDKLLTGKTADAIITSDTPPLLDTVLYRKPARRVIKNQVLGFCGIKAKTVIQFGPVKTAPTKRIANWLDRAERMGLKAAA
jgi:putative NADPH-quinone reductase